MLARNRKKGWVLDKMTPELAGNDSDLMERKKEVVKDGKQKITGTQRVSRKILESFCLLFEVSLPCKCW